MIDVEAVLRRSPADAWAGRNDLISVNMLRSNMRIFKIFPQTACLTGVLAVSLRALWRSPTHGGRSVGPLLLEKPMENQCFWSQHRSGCRGGVAAWLAGLASLAGPLGWPVWDARRHGWLAWQAWLAGCQIARLPDCTIAGSHDCRIARLPESTIARLHDCRSARLPDCIRFF